MRYEVSPQLSIMAKAGYKRCNPKMYIPGYFETVEIKAGEIVDKEAMTFDFSGFYIKGGIQFTF